VGKPAPKVEDSDCWTVRHALNSRVFRFPVRTFISQHPEKVEMTVECVSIDKNILFTITKKDTEDFMGQIDKGVEFATAVTLIYRTPRSAGTDYDFPQN
jgi:hypothetical protein